MKQLTLILSFCVISLTVCAGSGHKITIVAPGMDQPEIYLAYYLGDKQFIKDTAQTDGGTYVFEGDDAS